MDDISINKWLGTLADKVPTPGGGAVAALSAAIAAAQLGMVAIYTTGDKWADVHTYMKGRSDQLAELRREALTLVQADAEAFKAVGEAYALPKETDEQKKARTAAIQEALQNAAEPPVEVAKLASKLVDIADGLADKGNKNVISDVAVGASMSRGALESAIVNIQINVSFIKDQNVKDELMAVIAQAEAAMKQADAVVAKVRKQIG